jgi:hypothetical protein
MKRKATGFVNFETLEHAIELLGKAIGENLAMRDDRIKALEQRRTMSFAGPWKEGRKYLSGDCVQANGGLWLYLVATDKKPGQSKFWRLIVKSGAFRDGEGK